MLSTNLKRFREAKHFSRQQLADASGVHPNTIADIENGRNRGPAYDKVTSLARALGVEAEELWPTTDEREGVA